MSATHYDPKNIEENYYPIWENRGYFEVEGNASIQKPNKHFAIMLPPPNVTGSLHIGHALNHTLIDRTTNIRISNRAPSDYMLEIYNERGEPKFNELLQSHLLPVGEESPFWKDNFEGFLRWREDIIGMT